MSENRFDPVAHARAMRATGFWVDKSFDEFLQQTIAATPEKLALMADRADRAEPKRLTYAELGDLISRAAAALRRLNVGPGTSCRSSCRTGGSLRSSRSRPSALARSSIR